MYPSNGINVKSSTSVIPAPMSAMALPALVLSLNLYHTLWL